MDGVEGLCDLLPRFFSPYPVKQALFSRDVWLHIGTEDVANVVPDFEGFLTSECRKPAGTQCVTTFLPVWVPIAHDGSGDDLFVDLRTGPLHGCVMNYYKEAGAGRPPHWPGVREMLADVADAFSRGETASHRPYVLPNGKLGWS